MRGVCSIPSRLRQPLVRFPDAVLDGQKMLFTKGVDPDDDQNTEPVIAAAQPDQQEQRVA